MPRRKRSKKWISWVVIAILLVIAGVVVYFVWDGYFRDKGDKTAGGDTSDKSSIVDDNTNKSESATDAAEESLDMGVTDDDVLVNPTNEYENLTGVITYAGVSGSEFLVRTSIDQYLTDGACELTILQGGEVVYMASAAILPRRLITPTRASIRRRTSARRTTSCRRRRMSTTCAARRCRGSGAPTRRGRRSRRARRRRAISSRWRSRRIRSFRITVDSPSRNSDAPTRRRRSSRACVRSRRRGSPRRSRSTTSRRRCRSS